MKITITDLNETLIDCCKREIAYSNITDLDAVCGDIFGQPAYGVVSPGNSFGFMDGGIDLLYVRRFGWDVEKKLQQVIRDDCNGELLVGEAVTVRLTDPNFSLLIAAPTMRVPMTIMDPTSVRLATRAAVSAARVFKAAAIVMPGMGSGTGKVKDNWVAAMMVAGIRDALFPVDFPNNVRDAISRHFAAYPAEARPKL